MAASGHAMTMRRSPIANFTRSSAGGLDLLTGSATRADRAGAHLAADLLCMIAKRIRMLTEHPRLGMHIGPGCRFNIIIRGGIVNAIRACPPVGHRQARPAQCIAPAAMAGRISIDARPIMRGLIRSTISISSGCTP